LSLVATQAEVHQRQQAQQVATSEVIQHGPPQPNKIPTPSKSPPTPPNPSEFGGSTVPPNQGPVNHVNGFTEQVGYYEVTAGGVTEYFQTQAQAQSYETAYNQYAQTTAVVLTTTTGKAIHETTLYFPNSIQATEFISSLETHTTNPKNPLQTITPFTFIGSTPIGQVGNVISTYAYELSNRAVATQGNLTPLQSTGAFGRSVVAAFEFEGAGALNAVSTSLGHPANIPTNPATVAGSIAATVGIVGATAGIGEASGLVSSSLVFKGAIIGATISPIITEGFTLGKANSAQLLGSAEYGAIIGSLSTVALSGASRVIASVSPRVASVIASKGATGFLSRSLLGGGFNVALTLPFSQNPETLAENFGIGFAIAGAGDVFVRTVSSRVSPFLPNGPEIAERTGITSGKSGAEIPVFETKAPQVSSEFIESSGEMLLETNVENENAFVQRVVPDVSENLATGKELELEYAGKIVPTSHATLNPSGFDVNGETILQAESSQAAGFRQAEKIYPFYQAPGQLENPSEGTQFYKDIVSGYRGKITTYGGYIGIGEDESGKVIFGGKPTAIQTRETFVEPFEVGPKEDVQSAIERYLSRPGATSVGIENLLNPEQVGERQLETTTQYERYGEKLIGSKITLEGKTGSVQVRQEPETLVTEKIPILRNIENAVRTRYTTFNIYTGVIEPASDFGGKTLPSNYNQRISESEGAILSEDISSSQLEIGSSIASSPKASSATLSSFAISSSFLKSFDRISSKSFASLSSSSSSSSNSIDDSISDSLGSSAPSVSRPSILSSVSDYTPAALIVPRLPILQKKRKKKKYRQKYKEFENILNVNPILTEKARGGVFPEGGIKVSEFYLSSQSSNPLKKSKRQNLRLI
jgi:hypothetical protein